MHLNKANVCSCLCLLFLFFSTGLIGQDTITRSQLYFNHGSSSGAYSQQYISSYNVGQQFVGYHFNPTNGPETTYQGNLGYYGRFLRVPSEMFVTASEGDFSDRVLLKWDVDALSPAPTDGFKIYRDGAFLTTISSSTFEYIDFNVTPGVFYEYTIVGVNRFGEGYPTAVVGFVNPNGTVTGQVTSVNGNPVQDVQITLEPTIGTSLDFSQANSQLSFPYHPGYNGNEFSVSFWIKAGNDTADGILDMGKAGLNNWWVSTMDNGAKGVEIHTGDGNSQTTIALPFSDNPSKWQHVSFTYNGSDLNVYLNGELFKSQAAQLNAVAKDLHIGQWPNDPSSFFSGKLDELRIFSRQLPQTEIIQGMYATVPSQTNGLIAYWKFDEGIGYKTFDLTSNNLHGLITNAVFSNDRPDVLNSGRTDESGYYLIEGINYQGGQNFIAKPSKSFEYNNGLEFNGTNENYAVIDSFIPRDTGTIALWFKPSSLTGSQTILGNAELSISLEHGDLVVDWNGTNQTVTTLTNTDFVHFAMTYYPNGTSTLLSPHINGQALPDFTASTASWMNETWQLARSHSHDNYFTGILDELVFYNDIRSLQDIQSSASPNSDGVDIEDDQLSAFFSFNESVGSSFSDQSINNAGGGAIHGALWTNIVAKPKSSPHEFNPPNRIVTLNPSNTSSDNINFEDISTVNVSGFVRYQGTVCRAEGIEILVDGNSHAPPIMTDEMGYFSADFEPGSSFQLSPKYRDRVFLPAIYQIDRLEVPKAGIVFNDQTKRKVEGSLVGGLCEQSIIPTDGGVKLYLKSEGNDCFDQLLDIDNYGQKEFAFEQVPPIAFNLSVDQHPIANVLDYLQEDVGGFSVDVRDNDTSDLKFVYRAPTETSIEALSLQPNCLGDLMMNQFEEYDFRIETFEAYEGGNCLVDSVQLEIQNGIANGEALDTTYHGNSFDYTFKGGYPNLSGDHKLYLNVKATDVVRQSLPATSELGVVVLGKRQREPLVITKSPEIPQFILRDPPGDKSYSYLKKGTKICKSETVHNQWQDEEFETLSTSYGPDFELEYGTVTLVYDVIAEDDWMTMSEDVKVFENTKQYCIETAKDIYTSGDEHIVGSDQGGDVFVGSAINFEIGLTDVLAWDSCSYDKSIERYSDSKGFSTQFIYSENFIENDRIPNLLALGDTQQVRIWEEVLEKNKIAKANATYIDNVSFDAGTNYEFSEKVDTFLSNTYSWTQTMDSTQALELGYNAAGLGTSYKFGYQWSITTGATIIDNSSESVEIGFYLGDNDPGDYFSVDYLKDPVYGTLAFKNKGGASSCPYEQANTLPRDEPTMQMIQTAVYDVPVSEKATFIAKLGNQSQADHARVYHLQFNADSNPYGAIVNINGQPTTDPIQYEVDPGELIEVTITVEKGPIEYDYEDLELIFYSECERDRALNLHPDIPTDSLFEKRVFFEAHFVPSCSNVEIAQPLQDWVLTPEAGDSLRIVLNSYEKMDSLDLIKVQYRRIGGNGSWNTIVELPRDSLGDDFEIVFWDITGLSDGEVEVRAVSKCIAGLADGRSDVIQGRIERQGPQLLGLPHPSDGVLHAADQIYVEFSENIDCDKLTLLADEADVLGYVGLEYVSTGEVIDITVSCIENRIYMEPVNQNHTIENENLRATVAGIMDLIGNKITEAIEWEFYVDRNPLSWIEGDINEIKYADTPWQITRTIRNNGGNVETYSIVDLPSWLAVDFPSGDIAPGGLATLVFSVSDQIVNGSYSGQIKMDASAGTEILDIDLSVLCRPPAWKINAPDWDFNMTYTLELDVEGELSEDPHDIIAAFVGDELRGFAHIEEVNLNSTTKHLAFLTAYSNVSEGEIMEFQAWDASSCLLYAQLFPEIEFATDSLIGTPNNPQLVSTQNLILRKIPIHNGWNWISFNLGFPDPSIGAVLESLERPDNLFIKSQEDISEYNSDFQVWEGNLLTLDNISMYQIRGTQADTIDLIGHPIDSSEMSIPIVTGWNWIGYVPQFGSSVDSAMKSLDALDGDIVKTQTEFAQFVPGVGWVGSLDFMEAPNGYLLKSGANGILTQPKSVEGPKRTKKVSSNRSNFWQVNPSQFEFNMNMIAVVEADAENLLNEEDEIGAFFNGELRGASQALYIPSVEKYIIFLTVFSNDSGELMNFKYRDAATGEIHDLVQEHLFVPNDILGSVQLPEIFTIEIVNALADADDEFKFQVVPNPFVDQTFLHFLLPAPTEVNIEITDLLGQRIQSMELELNAGKQKVVIPAHTSNGEKMTPGLYLIKIEADGVRATEKVLLIK